MAAAAAITTPPRRPQTNGVVDRFLSGTATSARRSPKRPEKARPRLQLRTVASSSSSPSTAAAPAKDVKTPAEPKKRQSKHARRNISDDDDDDMNDGTYVPGGDEDEDDEDDGGDGSDDGGGDNGAAADDEESKLVAALNAKAEQTVPRPATDDETRQTRLSTIVPFVLWLIEEMAEDNDGIPFADLNESVAEYCGVKNVPKLTAALARFAGSDPPLAQRSPKPPSAKK